MSQLYNALLCLWFTKFSQIYAGTFLAPYEMVLLLFFFFLFTEEETKYIKAKWLYEVL